MNRQEDDGRIEMYKFSNHVDLPATIITLCFPFSCKLPNETTLVALTSLSDTWISTGNKDKNSSLSTASSGVSEYLIRKELDELDIITSGYYYESFFSLIAKRSNCFFSSALSRSHNATPAKTPPKFTTRLIAEFVSADFSSPCRVNRSSGTVVKTPRPPAIPIETYMNCLSLRYGVAISAFRPTRTSSEIESGREKFLTILDSKLFDSSSINLEKLKNYGAIGVEVKRQS